MARSSLNKLNQRIETYSKLKFSMSNSRRILDHYNKNQCFALLKYVRNIHILSLNKDQIKKSELKVANRGPDFKSVKSIENQTFAIIVTYYWEKPQPLYLKNSTLIYNGEIYNHDIFGNFPSDGFSILEAFDRNGINGIIGSRWRILWNNLQR